MNNAIFLISVWHGATRTCVKRIHRVALVCGCVILAFAASAHSQAGEWTWMGGSQTWGALGSYGTQGIPTAGNTPGSRQDSATWTDSNGNLWLFGGTGFDATGGTGPLNDLWKFSPSTGEWTWMGGSNIIQRPGVYGTMGTPAATNTPGARAWATTWTDSGGNFWLLGGWGYDANGNEGYLNDLWQFKPSTLEWTWTNGSSTMSVMEDGNEGQGGIYGPLGTFGAGFFPGGREGASTWTDKSGNVWILGGYGDDGHGQGGLLNDLWAYNPSLNEMAWMGGSERMSCPTWCAGSGVYGTMGVPGAGNVPSGRSYGQSWTDSEGNFWLYGGYFLDDTNHLALTNELWEFNPLTNEWAWMGGGNNTATSNSDQPGVWGTLGVPAIGNTPGARQLGTGWTDSEGSLWLFGGNMLTATSNTTLNDLWSFNPASNEWTWQAGSNSTTNCQTNGCGTIGVYGALGVLAPGNIPGGRYGAALWTMSDGSLWLFGGWGVGADGKIDPMNDLWRYYPSGYSLPVTAPPAFSLAAGTYTTAQTVTLTDSTPGAAIYYTTNGTSPTISSTFYTGAIPVSTTETIEAIAVAPGKVSSTIASAAYTITSLTPQTISFANPGTQTIGTPLTLSATATSGLPVSFTSGTPKVCTVSGTTATFVSAGTCTIDANQAGNSTYAAAPQVANSFTVNPSLFSCHVDYTVNGQWQGEFISTITIENTSAVSISNWALTWSFANGQTIAQIWDGTESQTGAKVTVTNMSYNNSIPAGGSYTGVGFIGTWNNKTNAVPTSFAVNGTTCK